MVNDWQVVPIGSLCEGIYDGPHATPKKTDKGPVFLGISSLNRGKLDLSKSVQLSEHDFESWTRRVTPQAGDVVFSYETRLGEAAIIPEGLKCCLGRRMALMRPDRAKVDPRFLLFAYLGPSFQQTIRAMSVQGSTVDRILLTEFPSYPIWVPPLPEQRAIAHILGTLDDKIECNRRMNRTLEEMARAIFKSWFVDFDPVKAKMEGRRPVGMDDATAALFPDELVPSELGMIPRGWRVGTLDDIIEIVGGGTPKTSVPEYWDGDIPWFSVVDAPSQSDVYVITTQRMITRVGLEHSSARMLGRNSTIISARGTVGKCALAGTDMAFNQSCYGVLPRDGRGKFFTYFALRKGVGLLQRSGHGSVFNTITRSTFRAVELPVPPIELMNPFEQLVGTLLARILGNVRQSAMLAELRKALLPKLISGETRVI